MSSSGGSPAVRLRTSHSPQSFVRCAPQLLSPVYAHVVDFLFHSYTRSDTVLWLAASPAHRLASSICVRNISSFFYVFSIVLHSLFITVLAFEFGLATWVQPFHPAPPRPSSFPERIWYYITGPSSSSRFPRRYASVRAMSVSLI